MPLTLKDDVTNNLIPHDKGSNAVLRCIEDKDRVITWQPNVLQDYFLLIFIP